MRSKILYATLLCVSAVAMLSARSHDDKIVEKHYVTPSLEETSRMRDEAAKDVPWGSSEVQMKEKIFVNDSKTLLKMFQSDEGATMCQGAAYYLHLKYLEAGYRSYEVGFASKIYSHAMVLVEIKREDGTKALIIQDPTHNITYTDRSGRVLSVFELMTKLKRDPEGVIVKHGADPIVRYLQPASEAPLADNTGMYERVLVGISDKNPGMRVYKMTLSLQRFSETWAPKFKKEVGADNVLCAIFARLVYVYKRYPMSAEERADAHSVNSELVRHWQELKSGKE